jgi:PKD domain-containing protein
VVTDPPDSAQPLSYQWTYGDGKKSAVGASSTARHAFAAAGTYLVTASVVGNKASDAAGLSNVVQIVVGTPPPPTTPGKPGTGKPPPKGHKQPAPPTGPVNSHGHRGGAKPQPGSGKQGQRIGSHHGARGSGRFSIPRFRGGGDATGLTPQILGQSPTVAGTDSQPIVSGKVIDGGPTLSLAAVNSPARSASAPAASPAGATSSIGVVPIYVGVVLLLLGVGICRERGWLALRHR